MLRLWLVLLVCSLLPLVAMAQTATIIQSKILIGTSSTPVLSARPLRIFLTLENISDTDIYCSLVTGTPAAVRSGTLLYSNGGKTFWDVPPTVPRQAIACIHEGTGTKELLYTEQY